MAIRKGRRRVPLVSCVLLTGNRPDFLMQALRLFNRQKYSNKELIILDDGACLPQQLPDGENVRYLRMPVGLDPSRQIDYGFQQARGELWTFWDDVAWQADYRLQEQSEALTLRGANAVAYGGGLRLHLRSGRYWQSGLPVEVRSILVRASAWPFGTDDWEATATSLLHDSLSVILPNNGSWFRLVTDHAQATPDAAKEPALLEEDREFYRGFAYQRSKRSPRRGGRQSPLVSCILPTANRGQHLSQAIRLFQSQDYPNRELVIVDDGEEPVRHRVPEDDQTIRYFRLPSRHTIGAKRNLACEYARGEVIVHWDDDDWSASWRLTHQVEHLMTTKADVCGLERVYFAGPGVDDAWLYTYPAHERPWVCGGTLCYRRVLWEQNRFPDVSIGEDNAFLWSSVVKSIVPNKDPRFYLATIHQGNTSPKTTWDSRWTRVPVEQLRDFSGGGWASVASLLFGIPEPMPQLRAIGRRTALLTLGAGIGDILRVTPLIRVLDELGYELDVAVETDYPEVVSLLEGSPEIRTLFHRLSPWAGHRGNGREYMHGLRDKRYDIAVHPPWTQAGQFPVAANRVLQVHHDDWINRGISWAVERLATEAGWRGSIPPPIAMPSDRIFDIPENTIALHPGCKPGWAWKKWHGFEELARKFPSVVIVGMPDDLDNHGTYFSRDFAWPEHAQNFVGKLGLKDMAALLSQCAALVSNDSGLMHLGAAVGIPTFGIFGITSPAREAMPFPNLFPITKQLPCEPACRLQPARRDCEYHLRCLQTLTPEEVFTRVRAQVPEEVKADRTGRPIVLSQPPAPLVIKQAIPAPPLEGAWYDEAYFESGGKGGWSDGYHWHTVGEQYTALACWLTAQLPTADSFLDAGCGKGFLIRGLRRLGKDCLGFDPSVCAIEHAVEDARPFLEQAGVDGYQFEKAFDVLLLIDLLEHLTAEQASAFLARARYSIHGCAVVAFQPVGARRHDRGRVTLRPASWWHDLFMQAGWKKDFLHREMENRMRRSAAEASVPWEIYVYAP